MSDFDPGPGWVEVPPTEATANREYLKHNTADTVQVWVREVPVAALPTAPYTVIRVTNSTEPTLIGQALLLDPADDQYPWRNAEDAWPLDSITGFEVLAEPRAVTAKAVLGRVVETAILVRRDQIELIREEFGVSDE